MPTQFNFFAGKGGVGKTTCAAASAVAAAMAGSRVLVVSTDPAHSLGDVLAVRVGSRPTRVPLPSAARGGSLRACEIDARRTFARWLARHRHALGDIVEHGTWLDREDVDGLLGLSMPGIDELVGLVEIGRMADWHVTAGRRREKAEPVVVVDTAPTGHTLRLVTAPGTVAALAEVLDGLQRDHRVMREQFARSGRPDAADRLIELLAREAYDAAHLLRDRSRTRFRWITLPEEMSLAEAEDGVAALGQVGIHVAGVIVNRVIPDGPPCVLCDRRRRIERLMVGRIRRRLGVGRSLHMVAAELAEPTGVGALYPIGRRLTTEPAGPAPVLRGPNRAATGTRGRAVKVPRRRRPAALEACDLFQGARLLFVGGKGGVGKTTIAGTLALRLAGAQPARRVLLLSTDPAHSLGDLFQQPIGDRPTRLAAGPENLYVRELDAAAAFASRRVSILAAWHELADAAGSNLAASNGEGVGADDLLELAPPGIDELFGVLSVVAARTRYPLVVIDTAPTGHALRMLETPDAALGWVRLLLRILLKYRTVLTPGRLALELVSLSRSIRGLEALLHRRIETRFITVMRGAEVTRMETERLMDRLRKLRVATPVVVVNAMTVAPGACRRCRAVAAAEARTLQTIVGHLSRRRAQCAIIQTPLAAPPPRGIAALNRWAHAWTT